MLPGLSLDSAGAPSSQAVHNLLHEGRARIAAGDVGGALKCVIAALEAVGGKQAILPTVHQALARWEAGSVQASDICELSSLLSSISVSSSSSSGGGGGGGLPQQQQQPAPASWPPPQPQHSPGLSLYQGPEYDDAMMVDQVVHDAAAAPSGAERFLPQQHTEGRNRPPANGQGPSAPILAETGRGELAECAMADGSSYRCPRCGGVVPYARKAQHDQWWCHQLPASAEDQL